MDTSTTCVSSTRFTRSRIQSLAPAKKASAVRLRMSAGATCMIFNPALLQVMILPSSSSVRTPFDMLSSMLSL